MKKFNKLFLVVLSLFSLSSCAKKEAKIYCDQVEGLDSLIKIDDKEFIKLINNKKDFALAIGQRGCLTCLDLISSLKDYVKVTNNIFYYIEISDYLEVVDLLKNDQDYSLNPLVEGSSIMLFDGGKDIKYLPYEEKIFLDSKKLKKKLDTYIDISGYSYINGLDKIMYIDDIYMYKFNYLKEESLDKLINQNQESTVLFTLTFCPDCQRLKNLFLDEYLIKNQKKLYVYETDGLRKENVDPSLYEKFKTKYQFDNYHHGRVPSFVSYKLGKKIDMSVFINDTIEEKDDKFIITDSFYKESIGITCESKGMLRYCVKTVR